MPIYTSLLTAGLLAASLASTHSTYGQSLNGFSTSTHSSSLILVAQTYGDDGDYLHRGSGR